MVHLATSNSIRNLVVGIYDVEFIITFYVGDLEGYETTDTYGEIQVQGDGAFTVEDFDILTIKG